MSRVVTNLITSEHHEAVGEALNKMLDLLPAEHMKTIDALLEHVRSEAFNEGYTAGQNDGWEAGYNAERES